jgi:glyoxylase-like metal-dependent hydrolase (beta-lactamase superfamily II)
LVSILASGLSYFDLLFRETPHIIATAVIRGPGSVALVDPGPSSTLPALRRELESAGVSLGDVSALLLTHIHLDHAGAAGTLVREHPHLRVYVHERGAPHMADPSKLLASAARLYGDAMDQLWGEVAPVPGEALQVLSGGERLTVGGRQLDVAYTPGHASHHVSYFSAETGVAFIGDTAGIKRHAGGFVLPPTPPPDIDVELWKDSLSRIESWRPETLFLTHFGPHGDAIPHLAEMRANLDTVTDLARASLTRDATDEDREAWFADQVRLTLRRRNGDAEATAYEVAGRFDLNWRGLARYWRKR